MTTNKEAGETTSNASRFSVPAGTWGLLIGAGVAALACGASGEDGSDGNTGPAGADGLDGEQGEPGADGSEGEIGAQGQTGPRGETGADGLQGLQGLTGEQGPEGAQGGAGPRGPQGPKGDPGAPADNSCLVPADCDDGLFCNGVEICDAMGSCQPGTPPDCDDTVSCTIDVCDESSASCKNVADDSVCDVGMVCDPALDCRGDFPVGTVGLVGYWTFDGGAPNDLSGNANHGVDQDWVGNPDMAFPQYYWSGNGNQAISYDGVDDSTEVPDSPSLDITTALTIETWVWWDGTLAGFAFLNKEEAYEIGIDENDGTFIVAIETSSFWQWEDSNTVVPSNEWVHLATTYDGTDIVFYVNGANVATVAHEDGGLINTTDHSLFFGARDSNRDGGADNWKKVTLDSVRLYNRVLDPTEIALSANWR